MLPLLLLLSVDPAAWVGSQGGTVTTDAQGRIIEASLGYTWVTDSDMEILAQMKDLRKLDLSLGQISERGMARLREMTSVRDLTLYYAEFVADVALSNIRGWKQLERLNLRGTDITDTSLEYIGQLTNLKSLDVSFTQITNNGLEHIANLTQLEELSLGGNKVAATSMQFLRLLPKLRALNLNGVQKRNSGMWMASVTDFDLDLFGALATLEDLNLGGTKVSDAGTPKLKKLAHLQSLDLSRTSVTTAALAPLRDLPSLRRLNLWRSKLDDTAGPRLAALKKLEVLDLAETQIGDKTLEAIAPLKLRNLYLAGTKVTDTAVDNFRKAHPECQVSWE